MCGIFSLINNAPDSTKLEFIKKIFNKGSDRGPDNTRFIDLPRSLQLGFHRLAINGLNTKSNQPMILEQCILICNGEIYNYKTLYNNLGIESLINRGCGYIIVVDAEHDKEEKDGVRSNQDYHGLRTLLKRHHIRTPIGEEMIEKLDAANEPLHIIDGTEDIPNILYIKLKSHDEFDKWAKGKPYNQPGFLRNLFGKGRFSFDPQFSTAKLDYDFAEHRNLSDLGYFVVKKYENDIKTFIMGSN